jgi:hypothetical protein
VNHHAQRIPRDRQVRKDACRPEQRVPVTCDYLHVAKAFYSGLEFPVEIGKRRWPALEQGSSAADPARVTLIDLAKGPITPWACPTHKVFSRPRTHICQGERQWGEMSGAGGKTKKGKRQSQKSQVRHQHLGGTRQDEQEKGRVKTRTLETHKGAAPGKTRTWGTRRPQATLDACPCYILLMARRPPNAPGKVTLRWLFEFLPWDLWAAFAGLMLAAFSFGIAVGQTEFAHDITGRLKPRSVNSASDPRIEQFIKAHNDRVSEMQKAILSEESSSGFGSVGSFDHRLAAERIRKDLDVENAKFEKELAQLK